MNFEPEIEFQPAEKIKAFQEEKLRGQLQYLDENSPYYHRLFAEHGIDIRKIQNVEDLSQIPFTDKRDLQLHNEEFLCVPRHKIVDYITTSGTLGDPVTLSLIHI